MGGLCRLDGEWLLAIDPNNRGQSAGWERQPAAEAQRGFVPATIEETFPGYDGVVWYWRRFRAPPVPAGAAWATLRFLATDYKADIWLNGAYLGSHEGGETPFAFDLNPTLEPDRDNLLTVRVVHVGLEPIEGMDLRHVPHGIKSVPFVPGRYHNYGGIWQSVELLALPSVRITDVFVQTHIRTRAASVGLTLLNTLDHPVIGRLEIAASQRGGDGSLAGDSRTTTLPPGETRLNVTLHVPDAQLWNLDQPVLYYLTTRLEVAGEALDQRMTRFGFREFTFRDGYFHLNDQRIMLKGTHTVGHYGMGLVLPRGPEQLRQELLNVKMMGINCCRSLGRMLFPEQLDFCDELGLLVYEETLASWLWESSSHMAERFDGHVREMILRDRNHPSLVIWGLLNETRDRDIIQHAIGMLPLIRTLDPTRLVLLHSGRWDDATAERNAAPAPVGPAALPYEDTWSQGFADFHRYVRRPLSDEAIAMFRTLGSPGHKLFQSEFGNGSALDPIRITRLFEQYGARDDLEDGTLYRHMADRLEADFHRLGLYEVFATPSDLVRASHMLHAENRALGIAALRANPNLCGYSITGMVDHTMVGEGLMTLFREPKHGVIDALREAWQPVQWSVFIDRTSLYRGDTLRIEAVLVNEDQLRPGRYPVRLRVSGPAGIVFEASGEVRIPDVSNGVSPHMVYPVFDEQVRIDGEAGRYEVRALFEQGGAAIGCAHIFVSEQLAPVAGDVSLWDADGKLGDWLVRQGLTVHEITPSAIRPHERVVLVNAPEIEPAPAAFSALLDWIAAGGTAVFLSPRVFGLTREDTHDVFSRAQLAWCPFGPKVQLKQARGCWWAVDHVVKRRPLTAGVPSGTLMDLHYYRHVHPHWTYVGLPVGDVVCAGLGIGTCGEQDNYWSGADLAVIPWGKGRAILSTLLIAEYVGRDPAADRLALNLATYTS